MTQSAIVYVKVPTSAMQRGFATTEEMGMTNKQFLSIMRAGICLKCVPDSDSLGEGKVR
jgi:hypothetical protein